MTAPQDRLVATVVAGKDAVIPDDFTSRMLARAPFLKVHVLHHKHAVDLIAEAVSASQLRTYVSEVASSSALDIIIQPLSCRHKKLLVADMESTMIEQEMLDELAEMMGLREKVAEITRRAMNGELDFTLALKERVALLAGQPRTMLDHVSQRITMMPGADRLLAFMHSVGAETWLVSGGFMDFAHPVACQLGFTHVVANHLMVKEGHLVGQVADPIVDKNRKREILEKACHEKKLALAETLVLGDGANDIPMLLACQDGGGLAIAYHAKPSVRAVITNQVNFGDLSALIYAAGHQGI